MTTAILTLLATLLGFAVWAIKRRAERKADPIEQHRERYEEIDREIAQGDGAGAAIKHWDDLDEIERLEKSQPNIGRHANGMQRAQGEGDPSGSNDRAHSAGDNLHRADGRLVHGGRDVSTHPAGGGGSNP